MESNIELSTKVVSRRIPVVREDLKAWLSQGQVSSIESLDFDIGKKDLIVYAGLAYMDIEMEAAAEFARKGDVKGSAHLLERARKTNGYVYGQLAKAYEEMQGMFTSDGITGNMVMWRDYVKQKLEGGFRRCNFILQNLS